MKFRFLEACEIEARVATVKENGVSVLLYKDARVDQRLLDETVGAENWQRSHEIIGGNLYCTVSIWDADKKQWIAKQDVGTESNAEKEKGQASDSFKRACFNWGIGRELYTAPFIWIANPDAGVTTDKGRSYCNERFSVKSIGYDEAGNISALEIVNKAGKVVFDLKHPQKKAASPKKTANKTTNIMQEKKAEDRYITDQEVAILTELCTKKGLLISTTFKKPMREITPQEFVEAVKMLNAYDPKGKA